MRSFLEYLAPSKSLLVAAIAASLVNSPKIHAETPARFQRITYEKIHFVGIASFTDDGQIKFEFSDKRPGPKTGTFQFWGVSVSQNEGLRLFLKDRALNCWQIYEIDGVGFVDCKASPIRGAEQLLSGSTQNWLDLFTWLPELRLARRHCNLPRTLQITTRDPEVAYFCQTSNGQGSYHSSNQATPIRAMPLVPSPY